MKEYRVTHGTFTIERTYPVKPEEVFGAFSDPEKKLRWFALGEGKGESFEMDFRIGGHERSSFALEEGPLPKGTVIRNETVYQDIVMNRRIVLAYTMAIGDQPFSASLATFEFIPEEGGTRLRFTEQGAYFEGSDGAKIREGGWQELLEKLGKELPH